MTIGFAQNSTNLKVRESAEFRDDVKSGAVISMHTSPDGLTGVIRNSKKHLLFDVFNEPLNRIKNSKIPIEKKENYYGNLSFGNTMKIFTVFSPSKKERIVYCHEFGINDNSHKKTKLFKVNVEKNQSIFSGGNKRETGFAMSPNGKYFVVSTDDIKKNSNSYTVHVYDSETLSLVYKKAYQENIKKFYQANDLSIDDDKNVFALGKLYLEGRSQKKKGKANYDFILNKISSSNTLTTKVDFNDNKEHISSLVISNIDNDIRLMGFFSEERAGKIKGALFFNVNTEDMTVTTNKSLKLPESVYKDLYSESKADRKKEKELSSYYVDYIMNDKSGNAYILAEEFFITKTYVSNGMNGGGYWVTTYHYNNLLVLKLNPQGDLDWGRSIFKRATAPSYNAFIKDDELHVILNSGKKLSKKEDGRVKVSKGLLESTSLYDIVFKDNGEANYNKIQDNKGKTFYTPYYGVYNNERFIAIGKRSGKKRFLILE